MEFRILGPLEVIHEGSSLDLGRRQQRAFLACLLLQPSEVVSIEQLVDMLWGDAAPRTVTGMLQAFVSRLRRTFGDAVAGGETAIVTRKPGYLIDLADHEFDATVFEAVTAEARKALAEGRASVGVERLREGLALWRGSPLSELALDATATSYLTRLEDLRVAATEELIECRLALGEHLEVLGEVEALIVRHPLRERLWVHRMKALYRSGRQADALRAYQQLRRLLADGLGIEPSPESKRLEQAILLHSPEVAWSRRSPARLGPGTADGGRPPAPPHPDDVLPLPLTRFIGRGAERVAVARRLAEARLVTLTGFGGCGKTRLALHVASEIEPRPSDGVRMAELSSTTDPAFVARVVASAVGVQEQPGVDLMDTLVAVLRTKEVLLIVDNCEQVLAACAEVVTTLLRDCPCLSILATSREPLGVPGEAAWPVPALSLPPLGSWASLEVVAASEAVQLFIDRASLVRPAFDLSTGNAQAIVAICHRLDGIALALELAASRVAALSPDEIAARLDDRFGLLTTGSATLPARQQTLQAAVEWSHDLLSASERSLLRWLSVFAGGATLEAAEEVCAECVGVGNASAVFDLLAALVSKSFVVADATGETTRYRLLETIAAYAHDRLVEAGEVDTAERRHAAWCVNLTERAEPELVGRQLREWLDRLEAERDNLSAAMSWALAHAPNLAVEMAGSLTLFFRLRSHFREGKCWFDRALSAAAVECSPSRAKALWGRGFLMLMLGDTGALNVLDEALSMSRESGDLQVAARSLLLLGNCRQMFDGHAMALVFLDGSVATAREARDAWCLGHALAMSGWAHCELGEMTTARSLLDDALSVASAADEVQGKRIALFLRGNLAFHEGDLDLAQTLLEEALTISTELVESYGIAAAVDSLGEVAEARGDYERAGELFERALGLARDVAGPSATMGSVCALAELALATRDPAADERVRDAVAVTRAAGGAAGSRALRAAAELSLLKSEIAAATAALDEARAGAEKTGDRQELASVLFDQARMAALLDDKSRSLALHADALRLFSELGRTPLVVRSLEALAGLLGCDGRNDVAVAVFAAADAFRTTSGFRRPPSDVERYEGDLALIRRSLGSRRFNEVWSRSAALSVDEAVSAVTRELDGASGRRNRG